MDKKDHIERICRNLADIRKTVEWTDENGIRRKGMTQVELAQRAGISQNHVARIEAGTYNVGIGSIETVAQTLGYTLQFTKKEL